MKALFAFTSALGTFDLSPYIVSQTLEIISFCLLKRRRDGCVKNRLVETSAGQNICEFKTRKEFHNVSSSILSVVTYLRVGDVFNRKKREKTKLLIQLKEALRPLSRFIDRSHSTQR